MSRFLASLQIGKTGSAFILERSGQLVATSTAEAIMSSGTDSTQLLAIESHNPTVRATAAYLRDHFGDLQRIQSTEQLDFNLNGERQLVQVMTFQDIRGLNWLIVTLTGDKALKAIGDKALRKWKGQKIGSLRAAPPKNMFPPFYQTTLRAHLNESQYLTLQLLLLLLQAHRQVKLSVLASVFPQPIQYQSRKRNLQRFLVLPQLNVKLLWFPLIKYWIHQAQTGRGLNRDQRRHLKKGNHQKYGYWIIAIDRTQWKGRNVFMVSLVWGTHALPVYWEVLKQVGNSDLNTQKRLLKAVLPLFKSYPVIVLGDREFHSPKLAEWLDARGVSFALRQKKDFHFQTAADQDYQVLKDLGFKPGMSQFYQSILGNKGDGIGPFNLAVYWKRKYRNQAPKDPWYILTNLPTLKQALAVYRCRWSIEQLFKDCKTGGYHLEDTKVNQPRFLALVLLMAIAYSLATMQGQQMRKLGIEIYAGRIQEHQDKTPRQSDFSFGLYGQRWIYGMELWHDWALNLIALKPHKQLYFQRGFYALSLMQQAV